MEAWGWGGGLLYSGDMGVGGLLYGGDMGARGYCIVVEIWGRGLLYSEDMEVGGLLYSSPVNSLQWITHPVFRITNWPMW